MVQELPPGARICESMRESCHLSRGVHWKRNPELLNLELCFQDCDSPDPRQTPNPHFLEKRVSGSKNPHFPPPSHRLEKGVFGQKNPHFRCVPLQRKKGFFLTEAPLFQDEGKWVLSKLSLPEKWDFGACLGSGEFQFQEPKDLGHTPKGSYSRKGVLLPSRCLLESPFLEPLLRTLLRTLLPMVFHCKTPSKNPS